MRAMGPETNTEGSQDPMTCAVLTCVPAGRRVKRKQQTRQGQETARQDAQQKEGGQKKPNKTKKCCQMG